MINPKEPDFANTPASSKRPTFDYNLFDYSRPPYVTIITPFYKTGSIFHETASSVLKQSFQQWEWLIINDGSDDPESLLILDEYRKKDERIRVIDHEKNKGLSTARNTGFREARTEYVVQIDSDDLLEPTAVEKWLWFLESFPEYSFAKGYTVGFGANEYLWNKGFHRSREFLVSNIVNPTVAIRKGIFENVGGYDENDFSGLMDWDFWLRCASFGYWGGTVPEYLDWYRRRVTHADRWPDFDDGERQYAYGRKLRKKYANLWNEDFPQIKPKITVSHENIIDEIPAANLLKKDKPRLLMILPWLAMGGADKFNLDLVQQITHKGWEVSIVTTHFEENGWYHHFASCTPDIFILKHFLRLEDYPRFLRYFIQSRQIDIVMISLSELGYRLLPYLRSHFPGVTFVDFCHVVEDYWNVGGFPRMAIEFQDLLELNIVSSDQLKTWMVHRGGNPLRMVRCYTNIDTEEWRPNPEIKKSVRRELGIAGDVPLIIYAGRLCEQKQPQVFAETMLLLKEKKVLFSGIVAGDGPDHKWLKKFLKKHNLNDIIQILGEASIQQMKDLLKAADILFLPSKWEGISLLIFEAMACGLPIVSADVGGQSELVTPECGFLVSRGSHVNESKQYAEILSHLIQNPSLRWKIGEAARKRVSKHFRLDEMGNNIIKIFDQAKSLHISDPRPRKSPDVGIEYAALALKYMGMYNTPEKLRYHYTKTPWGLKIFFTLKYMLEPFYHWGLNRGWTWLPPLAVRIKNFLVRSA